MSLVSRHKCMECLVWEERARQWAIEKSRLEQEIANTAGSHIGTDRLKPVLSGISNSSRSVDDGVGRIQRTGSTCSMNKRIARTGSFRVVLCEAETMTDPQEEVKPTIIVNKTEVIKKTVTLDLYDAAITEASELRSEVERLQLVLKRQDLVARDSINANQKQFLVEHMEQVAEEQKLRHLQRALMSRGIPLDEQHVDSPSVKRIFRGTDLENPLDVAKRLELVADEKRRAHLQQQRQESLEKLSPGQRRAAGLALDSPGDLVMEEARRLLRPENDVLGLNTSTCMWCTAEVASPDLKEHQRQCRTLT